MKVKVSLLVCIVALLVSSCSNPEKDFQRAREENTIAAFQNFINKHPKSEYINSAEELIDSLRFFEFQCKNNIDSLQAFKQRNSESRYVLAIDKMVDSLKIEVSSYYSKGIAYSDKGNYDKAIECFWEAIHINPDYAEAYCNMGDVYGNKGDHRAAIICCAKAANLGSKPAQDFCNNFGINYESIAHNESITHTDNYDQVIESYQKAIEINPDDVEAYCNLGVAYFNQSNYDKAIECYQKAIELDSGYAEVYYQMGIAYSNKKGNYDKFIECFQIAARFGNNPAQDKLRDLGISW